MTPQQISTVRDSFAHVGPIADKAAAIFYDHLFAADPSLRRLFKGDMASQGERLMAMIGAAIGLLEQPARLLPVLHGLGRRHAGYGVLPMHYDTVGSALLQTLRDGLGDAFTAEVEDAWRAMYATVAREMQSAAAMEALA
jgi:hemoglobin-like flavoprotein